jgi:hypothetical protein
MPRPLAALRLCLAPLALTLSCGAPTPPMETDLTGQFGTAPTFTTFKMTTAELFPSSNQTVVLFTEDGSFGGCNGGPRMSLKIYLYDQGRGARGPGRFTHNTGDGFNTPLDGYMLELHRFVPDTKGGCTDQVQNWQTDVGTVEVTRSDYWGAIGSLDLTRGDVPGSKLLGQIKGSFSAPSKSALLPFQ